MRHATLLSKPIHRAMLAVAILALALVLAPTAARADQYVIDHCANWDLSAGGVAFPTIISNVSDLDTGQPVGVPSSLTNNCGIVGGGLHLQLPGAAMPPASFSTITVSVPDDRPNIQIERIQTEFSTPAASGGPIFMPMYIYPGGTRTEIFNAQPPARPVVDRALPPGIRLVGWNVFCSAGGCNFASQFVLEIWRTRFYLNESAAPTLTVTGGSLLSPGAKSGTASIGFDAADTDSGVKSVTASLGSTVVAAVEYPCIAKDWSVCKRDQASQLLQVDTTKVPDGNHELVVTARDAANNVLTRSSGAIAIANAAAAGTGAAALPNGANPSRLAKLTARFTSTRKRSRRLRFSARPTVTGTLLAEQDQPIGGATVAILGRPHQAGATPLQIASATTGPDGAFSAKLPGGPSRTITFAYTAFSSDPRPAATATLKTVVRALVSASMPRSVRAGRRVRMTGRLRLLGRRGVEVRIQARDGRVWRTTDVVRTTSGGRFRWNYRFKPTARGRTFVLRARVASQNYPFASANSKPIRVRVR